MDLRRVPAAGVASAYAAVGLLWVLAGERLAGTLAAAGLPAARTAVDAGFVIAAAAGGYLLVRAGQRSLAASAAELDRLDRQATVLRRVLRHNVRNTVNVVRGYAEAVAEETDDPQCAAFAEEIVDSADELAAVGGKAKSLGTLTGPDPGGTEPVDLATVARGAARTIRRRYPDAAVEVDLPERLRVEAHPRLEEALRNLIENGIEHDDGDPRVRVVLAESEPDRVTVAVLDDGPGVPAVERRVVESGTETALVHSTGLGLWIARAVVARSGGELRVEDRGDGTAVALTLPLAGDERRAPGSDLEVPALRTARTAGRSAPASEGR